MPAEPLAQETGSQACAAADLEVRQAEEHLQGPRRELTLGDRAPGGRSRLLAGIHRRSRQPGRQRSAERIPDEPGGARAGRGDC